MGRRGKTVALHIARGMAWLHANGIIHMVRQPHLLLVSEPFFSGPTPKPVLMQEAVVAGFALFIPLVLGFEKGCHFRSTHCEALPQSAKLTSSPGSQGCAL